MLVRKGGPRRGFLTFWLDPAGRMAMKESHYPITELGFATLLERLIEVAQHDLAYDECNVRMYQGAKIDGRSCFGLDVVHPWPRDHFSFHKARVLIDAELQVPVYYASYTWPEDVGAEPPLVEEYTYRDVRLNVQLSDADFDPANPAYQFNVKQDADSLE